MTRLIRRSGFLPMITRVGALGGVALAALLATSPSAIPGGASRVEAAADKFELRSAQVRNGGGIQARFTCDGADDSPPLTWSEPPAGTVSFALIADDPDAPGGTWVHWVVFDLPASQREIPERVPKTEMLANGGRQGMNDFPKTGYNGPCPPPGNPHRYFFRLYALDKKLGLKPQATKADVTRAMQGHVLGTAELMGTYRR